MIDRKSLKTDKDYRQRIEAKGVDSIMLDTFCELDDRKAELSVRVEELRTQRNAVSKEIGKSSPEERDAKIAQASEIKSQLEVLEAELTDLETQHLEMLLQIPNPVHESVPRGGEEDFEVISVHGETMPAPKMDHADYGKYMGWIISEKATEISGSRFAYIAGDAVRLEFALVQWTLDVLREHGFSPVVPPVMVREQTMVEAGFFPTDRHTVYKLEDDDLFMVGTSEVPLSGLHRNEILDLENLPIKYAGFSSCFRREAGTYGKDTRGIFRVHQFDKVEMFLYANPENSWEVFEQIREIEEQICRDLGFSYRVISCASGDLGPAAAKKYDIEVWLPSEGKYREITSCSNYLDFASRRGNIRVKTDQGNELVHTLNGTAIPIARALTNLMEYYQKDDGSFEVPEVLRPYMGGAEKLVSDIA